LKLIGAGLPRTATTTQMAALEILEIPWITGAALASVNSYWESRETATA